VSKPELGTKRICAGCNAKFYDLHKSPIVCPACEAVFTVPKPAPARPRRGFEPAPSPVPVVAAPESAEVELIESEDAEVTAPKTAGDTDADVPLLEQMDED